MTYDLDRTDESELIVSRCAACGHRWYIQRQRCPQCDSSRVQRKVSSGSGVVAATTVLHPTGGRPYGVCMVDLEEQVRVMAQCDPGLKIGSAVTVGIDRGVPWAS